MRIIFLLLFACLADQYLAAQVESPRKPPTQKQVLTQIKEAKTQAQQTIIDYENEIAEARKNNEDPETIKEMEKNLVTLKKMLGVIDKAETTTNEKPKTIPKTTYTVPKYVSPIVPIHLTQTVAVPTEAQAKDRLLWYKGKKINNNTLVTTTGMVVQYDRQGNRVITQPEKKKDSAFISLVSKLSKIEPLKNDFATKTSRIKNSFLMYPEIIKAYQEFDYIRKRYDNVAKNTIDLPIPDFHASNNFSNSNDESNGGPALNFEKISFESSIGFEEAYQEFLKLLNNPPSLDFPAPPKRPNDLCLCDLQIRKNYENEMSNWSEAFWKYEDQLLSNVKKLERYLTDNSNTDISGMPNIYADLDGGLKLAMTRKEQKVDKLSANWGQDPLREETVIEAIISLKREKQKLGIAGASSPAFNGADSYSGEDYFDKYIKTEMDAKNYNVVFDYSLYLSHEFHKQLLNNSVKVDETAYYKWLERLEAYNRFTLTINMDFELHWGEGDKTMLKADGVIESAPVIVSVGRLGCKWQLFITNTDYERGNEIDFRIPMTVKNGTKRIKEDNHWVAYPYVGPKDMLMVFPSFRISFCPGVIDSAIMDVLRYKNEMFNLQNINTSGLSSNELGDELNLDPGKHYTLDMLGYANKMLVSMEKTKENKDQLNEMPNEMISISGRSSTHLAEPTGNSLLDEVQMEYSVNLQQHKIQQRLSEKSKVPTTVVIFDAHNQSDVLIDQPTDIVNDELEQHLVRGKLTLKVKHTPSLGWQFGGNRF